MFSHTHSHTHTHTHPYKHFHSLNFSLPAINLKLFQFVCEFTCVVIDLYKNNCFLTVHSLESNC